MLTHEELETAFESALVRQCFHDVTAINDDHPEVPIPVLKRAWLAGAGWCGHRVYEEQIRLEKERLARRET